MRACCRCLLAGKPVRELLRPVYERHRPEHTLLYHFVEEHYLRVQGPPGGAVKRIAGVRPTTGATISGALLDVWQNAANGQYENVDPTQPDFNFRFRMLTDDTGIYRFSSIRPVA